MDPRQQDVIRLLDKAPFRVTDRVLDVGMGDGKIGLALSSRVSSVVGTGLAFATYGPDRPALRAAQIHPVEGRVEHLPFADGSFDAVVMSHILEHCPNVGIALAEVRRVLKPNGLLCAFVPPHESIVSGGHLAIGWHIGQIMYVLLMAGFNVSTGHFAKKGYNVCAFVRKDTRPLPPLRHDFGDIRTLAAAGRWPLPLAHNNPNYEAFDGDLLAVNWPWTDVLELPAPSPRPAFGWRLFRRLIPAALRPKVRGVAEKAAGILTIPKSSQREVVNPKALYPPW